MPNRKLHIDAGDVPPAFYGLLKHVPNSQWVREFSCDCHEVNNDWQKNDPGHCLPHALSDGVQRPDWMVVSCIDSRFPIEKMLGVGTHKIVNHRTGGAALHEYDPRHGAWRDINLSLRHFPTIKGIAVIGHSSCGASLDLVGHFQRLSSDKPAENGRGDRSSKLDAQLGKYYNEYDHDVYRRSEEVMGNTHDDQGGYLGEVFSRAAFTQQNVVTLLKLSQTAQYIQDHLEHVGITDVPVQAMMFNGIPQDQYKPIGLLMQQADGGWRDVIKGRQPNVAANMQACARPMPANRGGGAMGRGIIPIVAV